jgi:hypothetical protein
MACKQGETPPCLSLSLICMKVRGSNIVSWIHWYGEKGRWVKYCVHLGCWISPCYGLFSLGACLETYEPFISLIFQFLFGLWSTADNWNCRYWISRYGGTTVHVFIAETVFESDCHWLSCCTFSKPVDWYNSNVFSELGTRTVEVDVDELKCLLTRAVEITNYCQVETLVELYIQLNKCVVRHNKSWTRMTLPQVRWWWSTKHVEFLHTCGLCVLLLNSFDSAVKI